MNHSIAIIIPVFREIPLWYEALAIQQALAVLHHYDHVLLCPQNLNLNKVLAYYNSTGKQPLIKRENPKCFESPLSYNRLLLSTTFYDAFASYDYILIHQTDAFVFRNELDYWAGLGFDYIGAPWIDWIHASRQAKNKSLWNKWQWLLGLRRFDAVGNGGLSLRRVSTMVALLDKYAAEAASYGHNEDFFFAFEVEKLGGTIKIPDVTTALRFAFDEYPEKAFVLAGHQLPMGCHGWQKYPVFWNNYISNLQSVPT